MTARRRVLLILASLTVHGGLVALLAVVSGTSLPSAIFIVLSELEPAAIATGPRQAQASASPPAAPPAPSRPTPPDLRPSPARSAPEAAVAPLAAPAPATPPEVLPAPAPPRSPEPVSAVSAIREETVDAPRSSTSASVVEGSSSGPPSLRGSELSRGGAVADAGTGSGMAQRSPSAGGDGAGTNVALAPSGSRGTEPGAEYGSYLSRMRGRIQEALRYPPAARRRGLKGTVLVEILIRPDGAITGVSVMGSSSHRLLDDAALEAVRSLPPQPFPAGLLPRPLTVQLPVVFDLQ